ncbi:disulfide oxidoreductase [Pithovirus sibericum]|uniref:Sulfhydryl oxidase n=1 Tax=Pithovirus sibericum TaxID=1450746 RepID=W5S5I2_9VIRU|nr:disulfide oxidoreductase [Pithovirus sibericum]AHH02033.1 disulfide oxidoreductase [Pithovirus sibericum]
MQSSRLSTSSSSNYPGRIHSIPKGPMINSTRKNIIPTPALPSSPVEQFPSDPTVSGQGLWYIIHTLAKEATTEEKKQHFLYVMNHIRDKHPCQGECRPHIRQYMKDHPLENYWNILTDNGEEIGPFLWAFQFHNTVNQRLGKRQLDWATVYHMYSESGIIPCTSTCGGENKETPKIETTKLTSKPKFLRREF